MTFRRAIIKDLEFEKAAMLRDQIADLRKLQVSEQDKERVEKAGARG
ncbi:MAG: UvrB/UvrC motif-containing protein [Chloroflexota bacterium]